MQIPLTGSFMQLHLGEPSQPSDVSRVLRAIMKARCGLL